MPNRNVDLDNLKDQFEHSQINKYKYRIYICCDHLFALTELENSNPKKHKTKLPQQRINYNHSLNTHKISVLLISHFLYKDGTFQSLELFSQEYDLVKHKSLNIHREAIAIMQAVAMLLKYRPIDDWHFEIESYRKQFLGSSYTPTVRDSNSFAIGQQTLK